MSRLLVVLASLGALLALAGAALAGASVNPTTSSNWSGYAIADETTIANGTTDPELTQPLTFTDVTATWKQPQVRCTRGRASYSAFWVGLGGYGSTSTALEQTGTGADCGADGTPNHYAWYELVPAGPVTMPLQVAPGDTITASVLVNGSDVVLQVKNRTRKTSFTKHVHVDAPDLTSAEWIAEAPSNCDRNESCSVLPLANFGSVTFTKIAAIGSGHPGTITDPGWSVSQLRLAPNGRGRSFFVPDAASDRAGASAAPTDPEGRSFTVGYTRTT
jgi:hypothetical protein